MWLCFLVMRWWMKLGEDAIRVIVKEFLLNAVGNVTIGMVMGYVSL